MEKEGEKKKGVKSKRHRRSETVKSSCGPSVRFVAFSRLVVVFGLTEPPRTRAAPLRTCPAQTHLRVFVFARFFAVTKLVHDDSIKSDAAGDTHSLIGHRLGLYGDSSHWTTLKTSLAGGQSQQGGDFH